MHLVCILYGIHGIKPVHGLHRFHGLHSFPCLHGLALGLVHLQKYTNKKMKQKRKGMTLVAWLVLTLVTSRCMQGMVNTNTWGCKQTCVSTCMGWINLHAMQTYMVYINIHIGDLAFMLFFMVTMALVSWHTLCSGSTTGAGAWIPAAKNKFNNAKHEALSAGAWKPT
jgi:hypothetical protein